MVGQALGPGFFSIQAPNFLAGNFRGLHPSPVTVATEVGHPGRVLNVKGGFKIFVVPPSTVHGRPCRLFACLLNVTHVCGTCRTMVQLQIWMMMIKAVPVTAQMCCRKVNGHIQTRQGKLAQMHSASPHLMNSLLLFVFLARNTHMG